MIAEVNEFIFIKPSFIDRIKSMTIDSFVIVGLLCISYLIVDGLSIESTKIKSTLFVLVFLYEPLLVAYSRTVGQRIMKIEVTRQSKYLQLDEVKSIGILFSIVRFIAKILLGWISLLTIHSDKYGRAIHDRLANSVMINRRI